MIELLQYEFMQKAIIACILMAIICPCIGIFLVLRKYSMISDTLSHASLAGVTLGLICGVDPIIGSFIFTSIAGMLIEFLRTYFRKYTDLILAIILSLSVGIALTIISSGALSINANAFLFGSILTITLSDIIVVGILTVLTLLAISFFFSYILYLSYDETIAQVCGVKVKILNYLFALLVAAAISVSIRIVGILVLSSLITLPVATAMQFQKGFKKTLIIAVAVSLFDVLTGLFLSYFLDVAPGGFTAIVSASVLIIVLITVRVVKKVTSLKTKKEGI